MSRVPLAAVAGIVFFIGWVVAVVTLADHLGAIHWALRALYFVVVGFVWVFPIRWLMLWAAHQR